ncbi:hypothetical protein [Bacillus cereus group sp. IBL03679]|uniref:hypothetical protein n=1 Tax=Bacillus cereus group sp. IBL03679 TaxID=3240095 RepID=UPI003D2F85E7
MTKTPEPNWQPISSLSLITDMIDGQLEEAQEQYTLLLAAQQKTYVLDEYTVHRVLVQKILSLCTLEIFINKGRL